jgi:5-methylthioribose kinase
MAQVKDVTTIADRAKRVRAERINILCAKDLIMNRTGYKTGDDFVAAFRKAVKAVDDAR